jgi:hypothetical protein
VAVCMFSRKMINICIRSLALASYKVYSRSGEGDYRASIFCIISPAPSWKDMGYDTNIVLHFRTTTRNDINKISIHSVPHPSLQV